MREILDDETEWDVIEILTENADAARSKQIRLYDIGVELRDVHANNASNIREIRHALSDLGYMVQ